jgi:hypothetical protein
MPSQLVVAEVMLAVLVVLLGVGQ